MIEQGLYFALGCIVTALAALAFAPLFWRRALRLTRRRLQPQIPLSMQEILSERDGLRAEFAVERLRVERAMEAVQASKAADMAAIGRHSVAASRLGDEVVALKRVGAEQADAILRLSRELAESNAEAGAIKIQLYHASEQSERQAQSVHLLKGERDHLHGLAESRGLAIAALEEKLAASSTQRSTDPREEGLAASMRNRLEVAMAHATRHETSSLSLRRELDEARARIRLLEANQRPDEVAARIDGDSSDAADAGLRSSIHALGLAVATMTRERRNGAEPKPPARRAVEDTPSVIDAG